jgi:PAS domain S-box-containing protein
LVEHTHEESKQAMPQTLRILVVEDNPSDAELMIRELQKAGTDVAWERVQTEADFLSRLASGFDVILAEYRLPEFGALRALELLKEQRLDVPLIVVSGRISEDLAVAVLKRGAADYLLKDRLGRLGHAVLRATEDKRLQNQGLHAEAQIRLQISALGAAANGIVITDRSGTIVWVNPAFTAMTGYTAEEAVGATPRLLRSGTQDPRFYEELWATILAGRVWQGQLINRRKDGSYYIEEQTITPVRDGRGDISHFVGIKQDVTARQQADRHLRDSEERFRQIAENVDGVVWMANRDITRMLYVSPAYERIWGRSCQTLYDNPRSWLDAVHPDDVAATREAFLIQVREGRPAVKEYRVVRPDGSVRVIRDRAFPVLDAAETDRFAGIAEDITERQQLEEQFRQAQKMEAVGRLAGGVAHDFNNLLTVILGFSDLALARLTAHDPLHEVIDQVRTAGERAASLTRQLLAFSRKQILTPESLDVNDLLGNIGKMLRRLIGEDINLNVCPGKDVGRIRADPGQIEQVVMNLVVNSRDAMPRGGSLTIETANIELDGSYAGVHRETRPGRYVRLAVTDTGCGMTPDVKARIFEPFFSTKGERGTGLGLATVYGIVKQSGGQVEVYSELGKGTTFKVYLPRDEKPDDGKSAASGISKAAQGTETVLVVEDEEGVRHLARLALTTVGYTVLEACCGPEAIALAERHPGPIHGLVTDLVMPKMSGREVAERLLAIRPDLKVLYVSGYTDEAVQHHGVLEPGKSFLHKPFNPVTLARKVREVLDGAEQAARTPVTTSPIGPKVIARVTP